MNDFERMIAQGNEHLDSDEYEKALESFKKALDKKPDDPVILDRLAKAYYHLGNYDLAEDYLMQRLESREVDYHTFNNLGIVLEQKGQLERALEYYQVAIEMNKQEPSAWINLGMLHFRQSLYEDALRIMKHANLIEPNDIDVLYYMAECYRNLDDARNLYKTLRKIIYFYPKDYCAMNSLGWQYSRCGYLEKGVALIEKAIKLNPMKCYLYTTLAQIYVGNRNIPLLLDTYLQAIMQNPKFSEYFWEKDIFLSEALDPVTRKIICDLAVEHGDKEALKIKNEI
jgi:tetratricopeptide (TPR) repeat protein